MDLLEDLRMSLLNFNFVMIHIIHKILVLIKNHLNYPTEIFLNSFLRSIVDFYFLRKIYNILHNNRKLKS